MVELQSSKLKVAGSSPVRVKFCFFCLQYPLSSYMNSGLFLLWFYEQKIYQLLIPYRMPIHTVVQFRQTITTNNQRQTVSNKKSATNNQQKHSTKTISNKQSEHDNICQCTNSYSFTSCEAGEHIYTESTN